MATAVQKIATLSSSRDIPFNKLCLSQANVRRTKAGVSVEELAEDIARRGLLQNLNVRPVLDGEGQETGTFEVPAGGRRFRALEILVRAKRLGKTAPVPCNVRDAASPITAEEDSLAENTQREPLHPLDQFRAFQALVERGIGVEEIAARFFVTPAVVKQRLRLASVATTLLDVYAEDGMTLEQLMAFTVTGDHDRQLRVWEALSRQPYKEAYQIRRMLTEGAVRAADRRAQFVGVAAYEEAGGVVLRDLFQHDDGGWVQDPALLDLLATEKLREDAQAVGAEGWKWIEVAIDFPYGHGNGLRRLRATGTVLTDDEQATYDALQTEFGAIEEQYADSPDDLPKEVDQRLAEIEAALDVFHSRPARYDLDDVARAGAFVSIDSAGGLKVERGFVRPEDEPRVEQDPVEADGAEGALPAHPAEPTRTVITVGGQPLPDGDEPEEDGTLRPLSERLVVELTAAKTVGLRDAVGRDPDAAHLAVLHALCLPAFYTFGHDTCLEISAKSSGFSVQAPALKESASAQAIEARHTFWAKRLPERSDGLWDALIGLGPDERATLFAHAASLTVNVTREPFNRRSPGSLAHGEVLAAHVGLDMAETGWRPTADNYLGRVPKVRILDAVRQAKGEMAAQLIDHLKKPEMAKEAERLLADTGWLPEPLVVAGSEPSAADADGSEEGEALPAFLTEDDEASEDEPADADVDAGAYAIAAE